MVFIETERLVLRNTAAKDADSMFDYRSSEICAKYQRGQTKELDGIRRQRLRQTPRKRAPLYDKRETAKPSLFLCVLCAVTWP